MDSMQIVKHLGCRVNLPAGLKGEELHNLPPYALQQVYNVENYPAAPSHWMRAENENEGAFFIGVRKGQGLWLDFNECNHHKHEVAVLISIQGINPLTGKPMGKPELEKYPDNSQIPQNYLATTGTPNGQFWLDGFRGEDGQVRQYLISEEVLRGIAAQVIGDNRTYSIGIAFFISKNPKPKVERHRPIGSGTLISAISKTTSKAPAQIFEWGDDGLPNLRSHLRSSGSFVGIGNFYETEPQQEWTQSREFKQEATYACCIKQDTNEMESLFPSEVHTEEPVESTKLEIAAGARIKQQIHPDPKELDFWEEEPASILYLNYTSEKEVKTILKSGEVGSKNEGALSGLTVGN